MQLFHVGLFNCAERKLQRFADIVGFFTYNGPMRVFRYLKTMIILVLRIGFVACGFEHCVANMYFIPSALFIKEFDPAYFATVAAGLKDGGAILTWGNFLFNNLLPATIGNIIGGSLLVGGMYWFIYLRPSWSKKG